MRMTSRIHEILEDIRYSYIQELATIIPDPVELQLKVHIIIHVDRPLSDTRTVLRRDIWAERENKWNIE